MSNYHYIKCMDCGEEMTDLGLNWGAKPLQEALDLAPKLIELCDLTEHLWIEIKAPGGGYDVPVSTEWLRDHAGHSVRVVSEYDGYGERAEAAPEPKEAV